MKRRRSRSRSNISRPLRGAGRTRCGFAPTIGGWTGDGTACRADGWCRLGPTPSGWRAGGTRARSRGRKNTGKSAARRITRGRTTTAREVMRRRTVRHLRRMRHADGRNRPAVEATITARAAMAKCSSGLRLPRRGQNDGAPGLHGNTCGSPVIGWRAMAVTNGCPGTGKFRRGSVRRGSRRAGSSATAISFSFRATGAERFPEPGNDSVRVLRLDPSHFASPRETRSRRPRQDLTRSARRISPWERGRPARILGDRKTLPLIPKRRVIALPSPAQRDPTATSQKLSSSCPLRAQLISNRPPIATRRVRFEI